MRSMKKKVLAGVLCASMAAGVLTGCGSSSDSTNEGASSGSAKSSSSGKEDSGDKVINLWAFTDEVPKMVKQYLSKHDTGYKMKQTIIATTDGAYQPALDEALKGTKNTPDIYTAESAFVKKYTQGDASGYAMPYEDLGIDVDNMIKDGEIAQYSVDIGTNQDGKVVGLGYQATGGCYIYRRSIAKKVFGTDDPKKISKEIGPGMNKFFEAAEKLKSKGFGIVSGDGDLWHPIENSSDDGWVVDGKLKIDPKREVFLDYSKKLKDNDYENDTTDWKDAWFADMKDASDKHIFGFFGPAWLVNYTLAPNCGGKKVGKGTYGDWAVTDSPIGFFWGGTWLLANKALANASAEKKKVVADILTWITLDTSKEGLQYKWANGTLYGEGGTKDAVASGKVMKESDGSLDFLGGQNMFEYFIPANANANGKNLTQYDEKINQDWRDQVRQYAHGKKSKEQTIKDFKEKVQADLGLEVE